MIGIMLLLLGVVLLVVGLVGLVAVSEYETGVELPSSEQFNVLTFDDESGKFVVVEDIPTLLPGNVLSVPLHKDGEYLTTQFTTQYLVYDTVEDELIVQVFSQGCMGPYFVTGEEELSHSFSGVDADKLTYEINNGNRYRYIGVL